MKVFDWILWGIFAVFVASFLWVMFYTPDGGKFAFWLGAEMGAKSKRETLEYIGLGIGGVIAVMGALALNQRAKEMAKNNALIEKGHINERFKAAVESLANAKPSARIASFYQFYYLAVKLKNDDGFRKSVFDILCAHLRDITIATTFYGKNVEKPAEEVQSLLGVLFKPSDKNVFAKLTSDLRGAYLIGVDFDNAELKDANFEHAILRKAIFMHANLENAKFMHANLENAKFRYANLENAKFMHANLENAKFRSANLQYANFRSANLQYANFWSANLENAKFRYANLENANFFGANLENANFRDANLENAKFFGANLENANFRDANLENAKFMHANLENAKFRSANLGNANFSKVKNSNDANFMRIEWDDKTVFPPKITFTDKDGEEHKTGEGGKPKKVPEGE